MICQIHIFSDIDIINSNVYIHKSTASKLYPQNMGLPFEMMNQPT